ncbi:MAG: radical SAM protein [Peptococcaceae bacterium]|nr:B12-binding domain-containing radical SAM protein [Peptococcaceae bacterium]MDH7525064.1 radical SAM protein [Peptococcaceae bacterium]
MRYEGTIYRPPSEASSLIIQATVGCPHNKCNFCRMYKDKKFKIRPVREIKEDLDMARDCYGPGVRSLFFADGNTILMKTKDLVEIFQHACRLFPGLQRITVYGSARYIVLKTCDELRELREAGLTRLHSGMESGDDRVLKLINKGTTSRQIIEAGLLLKSAGIELSEYYMVGVGGRELWRDHAVNSARVLNRINPDFIRLRTFTPYPGTPMHEAYKRGEFGLLSPHEALMETRLFIENLEGIDSRLFSDHISNYWYVEGRLPGDREEMLRQVDYALTIDERNFRDPEEGYL